MQTAHLTIEIAIGVVSAILFYAISKLTEVVVWKMVVPAIFTQYDGINLEATWKNKIETSESRVNEAKLTLKQRGKWLRGTMTLFAKDGILHNATIYRIKGKIINGFVKLEALPEQNTNLGFSAGIFTIENNGAALKGSSVYIDNFSSNIDTHNKFSWERS